MTCPFCNKSDGTYDLPNHYYRHQIEEIRRIAKALEFLGELLDERLPTLQIEEMKLSLPAKRKEE